MAIYLRGMFLMTIDTGNEIIIFITEGIKVVPNVTYIC